MVILDFQSKRVLLFMICKSLGYFLPSFKSAGLSCQENKFNIDFQDGGCGGHLGCPIGKILIYFWSTSCSDIPTKFESMGVSFQEKKRKIDFQDDGHGSHIGSPIRTFFFFFFFFFLILICKSSWYFLYQISSQLAFQFRRGSKYISMATLDLQSERV